MEQTGGQVILEVVGDCANVEEEAHVVSSWEDDPKDQDHFYDGDSQIPTCIKISLHNHTHKTTAHFSGSECNLPTELTLTFGVALVIHRVVVVIKEKRR